MDLLERLREAQADTKRDMKRADLRTKDVLLLSDLADVFGECATEIESLRAELEAVKRERDELAKAFKQFAECDLNDGNCASLEVATRRIRSLAQAALAKVGKGE